MGRSAERMRLATAAIGVASQAVLAAPLVAQTLDYHREEAPAVSWNGVGFQDARMLSLGGVSLLASTPFLATANPALIPKDRRFGIGASGTRVGFEAMQYWGVNQGTNQATLASPRPPSDVTRLVSGLAGHLAARGFGLAAGWHVGDVLRFPGFERVTYYGSHASDPRRTTSLSFSGQEDVFFVAAVLPEWKGLRLGARLEYLRGRREVSIGSVYRENWWIGSGYAPFDVVQRQEQSHETRAVSPSLGISWQITRGWTVAAQAAWPLDGTADRSLTRSFEVRPNGVTISDRQTTSDRLDLPPRATLGTALTLELSKRLRLRLGGEAAYAHWSGYVYDFFGEEQPRIMRDTFGLAAGVELVLEAKAQLCLRLGYRRDPQPLEEPAVTLQALSGGLGVSLWRLSLDAGASRYQGAAGGITQNHTVVALTLGWAAE